MGPDVVDLATFVINAAEGTYRLYVPYPAGSQILRYEPTADGSGFSVPGPYFLDNNEPVETFKQIMVDGDLYAVTPSALLKYFSGTNTGFSLDPAPDDKNLRPGHSYGLLERHWREGQRPALHLGQPVAAHPRLQQERMARTSRSTWQRPALRRFADITGMYIIDRGVTQRPSWSGRGRIGLYQAASCLLHSTECITWRVGAHLVPASDSAARHHAAGCEPIAAASGPRRRHCRRALSRPNGRAGRRRAGRALRPRSAPDRE